MSWPHDVLACFRKLRRYAENRWLACCPAHDDDDPSLGLMITKGGLLWITCFAGCDKNLILEGAGLKMSDLFPPEVRNSAAPFVCRREVAYYDYVDEGGEVLFQVVRYEPKDFRQRQMRQDGSWRWSMEGVRRVVYRLPELLAAPPERPVWLVEGEEDVHALERLGLLASTCPMGAGKWDDSYGVFFAGRRVLVVPDNDEPGRRHADSVVGSLVRHGAAVICYVDLPGLPPKGDVRDWLRLGHTKEELLALPKQCNYYKVQKWSVRTR